MLTARGAGTSAPTPPPPPPGAPVIGPSNTWNSLIRGLATWYGPTAIYNPATQVDASDPASPLHPFTVSTTKAYPKGSTQVNIADKTVPGVSNSTTCHITTVAAHGFSDGNHVIIGAIKGMGGSITSDFYVKKTSNTTFDIYTDAGLTTPFDSSGLGAQTNGNGAPGYVGIYTTETYNVTTLSAANITGGAFPQDGDGYYRIDNFWTHQLVVTGSMASSIKTQINGSTATKLRMGNWLVKNLRNDSNPQDLNPYTGHSEFNGVLVHLHDFQSYKGCGGTNSYDASGIPQGQTIGWANASGLVENFYHEQFVYDAQHVGSTSYSLHWRYGSYGRNDNATVGSHTDCFQVVDLDNTDLWIPSKTYTWSFIYMSSGGNACLFLNNQGGSGSVLYAIADANCVYAYGNKAFDLAGCDHSGGVGGYINGATGGPNATPKGFNIPYDVSGTPGNPANGPHPAPTNPVGCPPIVLVDPVTGVYSTLTPNPNVTNPYANCATL